MICTNCNGSGLEQEKICPACQGFGGSGEELASELEALKPEETTEEESFSPSEDIKHIVTEDEVKANGLEGVVKAGDEITIPAENPSGIQDPIIPSTPPVEETK